ncbi:cytochrome c oxidase subunit III [Candidatus Koribacter versatilis Ellin345]|uniref:Cytochrome c oxidase subunit III n=1 Tax=Koribacter versatilis (strain Ellin345) TaxID=204669 RepID=Q1IUK6_KORVE|nr:cytochrome c oxidase subunit 3 [Candidatus Koribacter versatilis]ABF39444.1 cytochrome c oxidase subunit III [Candidatus Koribacter versatilis Ellin345]
MSALNEPLNLAQAVEVERQERRKTSGGSTVPPSSTSGRLPSIADPAGESVRTGVWVGLATIAMMFAAFTSAVVVRKGASNDWTHIVLPNILLLNSAVLVASSITLEIARKKVKAYAKGTAPSQSVPLAWLGSTLALGLIFVVGQFVAWSQLKAQGVYLATSPNASFFYVLTVIHAIHVAGGLGGLTRVILKTSGSVFTLRRSTLDGTAYYWHFMGALWIYVVSLLYLKF